MRRSPPLRVAASPTHVQVTFDEFANPFSQDFIGIVPKRSGFTLLELMVSLGAAGVLMAGLSSALFMALKATDTTFMPTQARLDSYAQLSEMISELQYAQTAPGQAATSITVTVPDRDFDLIPETIRYDWSGTPGDPLTRQYNGGTVANVAENVHDFDIQYFLSGSSVVYLTVRLQITSDTRNSMETAVTLLNRP